MRYETVARLQGLLDLWHEYMKPDKAARAVCYVKALLRVIPGGTVAETKWTQYVEKCAEEHRY